VAVARSVQRLAACLFGAIAVTVLQQCETLPLSIQDGYKE
jgi:hypothetical protein